MDIYKDIYEETRTNIERRLYNWRPEINGGLIIHWMKAAKYKKTRGYELYVDEGTIALLELMKLGKSYEDVVRLISEFKGIPEISAREELNEHLEVFNFLLTKKIEGCPDVHPYTSSAPHLTGLEITSMCNLKCSYCYADSDPLAAQTLSLEQIKRILDQMKEVKIPILWITGGEPLIHPDIHEILKEARKRDFYIAIATNGIPLYKNQEKLSFIQEYVDEIQVAVDGATPETHEYYRGKNTFNKVIEVIRSLVENRKEGNYFVVMGTTVGKSNYKEMPQIIKLAFDLEVDFLVYGELIPLGRGSFVDNEVLTCEELVEVYKTILATREPIETEDSQTHVIGSLAWVTPLWPRPLNKTARCSAINFQIQIHSDGSVYPCVFLRDKRFLLGNVLTQNLADLLNTPIAKYFKKDIDENDVFGLIPSHCKTCNIYLEGRCNAFCKANPRICTKGIPGSPLTELEMKIIKRS